MSKLTKKLINDLVTGKTSEEEYFHQTKGEDISEDFLKLLEEIFNNKDGAALEEVFLNYSLQDGFTRRFSDIFCKLLQEDWHYKHEDLAFILQKLQDASTIKCLFNAAQLHFDYLNYDDAYQFARKCIKALSAINNTEAINKLRLLAENDVPEIRQYAIKELTYKGLSI